MIVEFKLEYRVGHPNYVPDTDVIRLTIFKSASLTVKPTINISNTNSGNQNDVAMTEFSQFWRTDYIDTPNTGDEPMTVEFDNGLQVFPLVTVMANASKPPAKFNGDGPQIEVRESLLVVDAIAPGSTHPIYIDAALTNMPVVGNIKNQYNAGIALIQWEDTGDFQTLFQNIPLQELYMPFEASFTKVDVSSNGGTDGSIDVTVINGSGDFSYSWLDGPITQDRSNLASGSYQVTITDNETLQQEILNIEILEPSPIPDPPGPPNPIPGNNPLPTLEIAYMNSLRWVVPEIVDNCAVFENHDNLLYCDMEMPGYNRPNIYELVATCDIDTIQFQTNVQIYQVDILDYNTGVSVKSIMAADVVEQNVNVPFEYPVQLENHGGGQTRILISEGVAGTQFEPGRTVTIQNNGDGFNGTYVIQDRVNTSPPDTDYVVINANYGIAAPQSAADAIFYANSEDYDIVEMVIDWSDVPEGIYQCRLTVDNGDGDTLSGFSEPVNLKVNHPGTTKIKYKNFDNAFGIHYESGIEFCMRVPSRLLKRVPTAERTTLRNCDESIVKVAAKKRRRFIYETYMLPFWKHEKLSVIFDHDFFTINEVEYQTEDDYAEPTFLDLYPLANSSIIIEQKVWFDNYNGDDVGPVDFNAFVIGNDSGFIKR